MISNDNLRHSIASESTFLAHSTFNVKTINQQLGEKYEEVMEEKYKPEISRQRGALSAQNHSICIIEALNRVNNLEDWQ